MDKETKRAADKGKTVTAEKTFTAEKADGSVELELPTLTDPPLVEKIVVFEKLYFQGRGSGTRRPEISQLLRSQSCQFRKIQNSPKRQIRRPQRR